VPKLGRSKIAGGKMKDETKCEGEHLMRVYFCEETPKEDSYFIGVCTRCGAYEELPVRKIEEIFTHV
jgi:hypothetical protein